MNFNERVRKLLGLKREKTIEQKAYEKLEEAKWKNTKMCLETICRDDELDYQVSCTYIDVCDEEEGYDDVSYNVLPVYKEKKKVSRYEEMLNSIGLSYKIPNLQNEVFIEANKTKRDKLTEIIEAKDIEFVPTTFARFVDGEIKLEVDYDIVIINDDENKNDEEVKITLNIDSKSFEDKPDKRETAAIQKRMSSNKKQITVPEFIAAIEEGRSFKAAALNGNKNIDWESQQVFALDIDNDEKSIKKYGMLTPEDAVKRFNGLGVPPAFYYESFSSTMEKPKFRLIFILKNPVKDIRIRNAVQMALMNIAPEADQACKDLSRLFYGTNKLCLNYKDNYLDPYNLIVAMVAWLKNKDKINYNRNVKSYCERIGLNVINDFPYVMIIEDSKNEENTANSIIYNIENALNSSKTVLFNFMINEKDAYKLIDTSKCKRKLRKVKIDKIRGKRTEIIRGLDFERLENSCMLWRNFINGRRWCYHSEIFGIACNMWRVEGAQSKMIRAIENKPEYTDKYNKINTIKSCSAYGYMPSRCTNFCPYHESCSNTGLNILHSVDNTRGSIRKVEETSTIKLNKAEERLKQIFLQAYLEEGNSITIIKGGTGIGKTTLLNSIPDFHGLSISYPNHRLGDDIVSRVKVDDALHLKELNLSDSSALNEFKRLQSIGSYKSARLYLEQYKKSIKEKRESEEIEQEDADKIVESITSYIDDISKASITTGTIFSTHKKMLELKNNNIETYIIDEDILLNSIISTESLDISQINNYIKLSCRYEAKTITRYLNNLKTEIIKAMEKPTIPFKVEGVPIDIREVNRLIEGESNNLKVNLKEVLNISSIVANDYGEVLGMSIGKLPDKKCIVLSATANEKIYRLLFPTRNIRFVDVGNIETEGEIILHYTAFSRNKLSKEFDKSIDRIRQETEGINNVITFAKFENKFQKAGFNPIAHFGACSGLDAYKGEDLIVAGTPHIDERVYILLASIIEEKFQGNHVIKYSNVIRNGYEFYFNTFESSELLQEIQFYFIESELVQAVGRARILRTAAKVHLFSNYPIIGSKLYNSIA